MSMNVINSLITDLNAALAPLDTRVLAETLEWAKGRVAAVRAYKESEDYKTNRRLDSWGTYAKMWAAAGGKTWFNVFEGRTWDMIVPIIHKICAANVAKRNTLISKKLEKAGVTKVLESAHTNTNDGFRGHFVVWTNEGSKNVTIETIYAGGYNIQCLHLRTLVKVK